MDDATTTGATSTGDATGHVVTSEESTIVGSPGTSEVVDDKGANSPLAKMTKGLENGTSRKVHNCPYNGCGYSSTHFSSLRQHLAYIHDEGVRWFSCDLCDYKAKKSGTVRRHKADVHNIDVVWYPCTFTGCNYRAKQKSHMKRHVQVVHVQKKVNEWKFCPYCLFRTKSQKWLVRHTDQHRKEDAEYAAQQNSVKGMVKGVDSSTLNRKVKRHKKVDKRGGSPDATCSTSPEAGVRSGVESGGPVAHCTQEMEGTHQELENNMSAAYATPGSMDPELLQRQRMHAGIMAANGGSTGMAPTYASYPNVVNAYGMPPGGFCPPPMMGVGRGMIPMWDGGNMGMVVGMPGGAGAGGMHASGPPPSGLGGNSVMPVPVPGRARENSMGYNSYGGPPMMMVPRPPMQQQGVYPVMAGAVLPVGQRQVGNVYPPNLSGNSAASSGSAE